MKSKEYRAILNRLPVENPTPEDIALLCPHLTQEQAVEAFSKDSGYVACPSLRIRNAFQIVSFSKAQKEEFTVARADASVTEIETHPARLDWSYAGRTPESYSNGNSPDNDFCSYQHTAEAIQFSNTNWGNELILDTWVDVINIYLQDPTDLHQEGFGRGCPKTKMIVYVGINRPLNDIINDFSKPQSALIDEAISEMALDLFVGHEIQGERGTYSHYNCATCGDGLGLNCCPGCGHRFKDDQGRSGSLIPLSPKIVEFLRDNGHVFKNDPKTAWRSEAERYKNIIRKAANCPI